MCGWASSFVTFVCVLCMHKFVCCVCYACTSLCVVCVMHAQVCVLCMCRFVCYACTSVCVRAFPVTQLSGNNQHLQLY